MADHTGGIAPSRDKPTNAFCGGAVSFFWTEWRDYHMKLKDVMNLRARIYQELCELQKHRNEIATVTLEPGENWEDYLLPDERVEILTRKIDRVMEQYLGLTTLIRQANNESHWEGPVTLREEEAISDKINRSILLRREGSQCRSLGQIQPRKRTNTYGEKSTLIEQATFDIKAMEERGRKLEKQAQKLSDEVNQSDMTIDVDVPEWMKVEE